LAEVFLAGISHSSKAAALAKDARLYRRARGCTGHGQN
jgi:hypothetical protein